MSMKWLATEENIFKLFKIEIKDIWVENMVNEANENLSNLNSLAF